MSDIHRLASAIKDLSIETGILESVILEVLGGWHYFKGYWICSGCYNRRQKSGG